MSFDLERDHVGPGWQPIVDELHKKLLEVDPKYTVEQIKEKFGGLRYYFTPSEDLKPEKAALMQAIVIDAEKQADKTCEYCGEPAKIKLHGGWYKCLCDKCGEERKARAEARKAELNKQK